MLAEVSTSGKLVFRSSTPTRPWTGFSPGPARSDLGQVAVEVGPVLGVVLGEPVDDLTVDLITKGPYPLVLNLATYIFAMDREFYTGTDERGRPKDGISKHGASFASSHVAGTGPFIVTEREQGVKLEFKRFADYWDKSSPGNVDRIVLTPIKEPATRVAALLAGDVDFIAPVPPTDFDRIKGDRCCQLITMLSTRILTFELNQARVAAFRDPRVRLAINYAINRQGIVDKILRGFGTAGAELGRAVEQCADAEHHAPAEQERPAF